MADHGHYREEFPDEHPHSYDHQEPKGSLLFILFGVSVALVLFIAIGVQFYYDRFREQQVFDSVLAPPNNQLTDLRAKEDQELHSYGYADKAVGKVRMPIERAMELVAQEARENRVKWPTKDYAVKTAEELAAGAPAVSPAGAAAANDAMKQGTGSSPAVQVSPKR
jgi:hypothetical protein